MEALVMAEDYSKTASDKIRSVFSDEFFLSEDGARELLRGLKARGKTIADFETALEIAGPKPVSGAYRGDETHERVCDLTRLLNPRDRHDLKSWYLEQAQGVKCKFPGLPREFPCQFDDVVVLGATGSPEEWRRALRAPASELPPLDSAQREDARRRGVSESDYARGVLLEKLAEKRWQERGQALGDRVREVLKPLGSEYRLVTVLAEVARRRWTVRFEGGGAVLDIHLDGELVDDLLNYNALEDTERLRVKLLKGLGRGELVVRE
jgi:hypothetical protein